MNIRIYAYWYKFKSGPRKWHLMTMPCKAHCEVAQTAAQNYATVGPVFKLYEGKVRGHP